VVGPSAIPNDTVPSGTVVGREYFGATLPEVVAGLTLDYEVLALDEYRTSYLISAPLAGLIEDLAADPGDVPIAYARTPGDGSLSIEAIVLGERLSDDEIRQALLDLFVSEVPWTIGELGGKEEVASTESEDGTAYVYVSDGVAFLVLIEDPTIADELFRQLMP